MNASNPGRWEIGNGRKALAVDLAENEFEAAYGFVSM
jgi:hypothetical protein